MEARGNVSIERRKKICKLHQVPFSEICLGHKDLLFRVSVGAMYSNKQHTDENLSLFILLQAGG